MGAGAGVALVGVGVGLGAGVGALEGSVVPGLGIVATTGADAVVGVGLGVGDVGGGVGRINVLCACGMLDGVGVDCVAWIMFTANSRIAGTMGLELRSMVAAAPTARTVKALLPWLRHCSARRRPSRFHG